jgi:uncharacterized damage-inducible protein DinB
MRETERIREQYERALNGNSWHGDNVWKTLGEVRPEQAFHRVLPDAHTIWELVAHMAFWESQVTRRLRREPELPEAELNFPRMPAATAENWQLLLEQFRRSNEEFRAALSKVQDSQLDDPLSSPEKSVYIEVHGVIQHHLYHAGQIAILRKNLPHRKVVTGL